MPNSGESGKIVGRNTVSGRQLMDFIERIERIREAKKQLAEDEKLVFAELKASGFNAPTVRNVLKRRAAKPADVEEAEQMLDMYLHAIGMANEAPLFRAIGMMSVDLSAREQVIEAFKQLVPIEGEIIVKIGKQPVRLWRDESGTAQAEDVIEKPKPAAKPAASGLPERPRREVPDVDAAGARELGAKAYRENQPITTNPFPWDDKRRGEFDAGWRAASGTDGMGPEED
ncbi:DUF2312 domain-containing protein [Chelativorans sp.]|uniref:DUF2312 domain-containing protein n=1 Tax=Chelativorans sp. TaxID=2203393 RepID=UPI0028114241|nr:DUF2312 domain-containing protein [Chelativorans sp.]